MDHRSLLALPVSATLAATLAVGGCGSSQAGPGPEPDRARVVSARVPAARPDPSVRVLAISVDGLNPAALTKLGAKRLPHFYRLIRHGASTLNARTEYEQNVTLPNHTGMMTGRRITASKGGHGVTWDDDRPRMTVTKAAGHFVSSVFTVVHRAGGTTALFSTKPKFRLYDRSWPVAITRFHVDTAQTALVRSAVRDLVTKQRPFTFLHVSLPDQAGHAYGGMSARYLTAVRRTDAQLGLVLTALDRHPALKRRTVVILTADHGFLKGSHSHTPRVYADYRVPFVVWGKGVAKGRDLYALNPAYKWPGTRRPTYAPARQPVRNGDVADLALDLLGLRPVPGSILDRKQNLRVR